MTESEIEIGVGVRAKVGMRAVDIEIERTVSVRDASDFMNK